MKAVLQIVGMILIVGTPIGVAIAPKPWQRACLMIVFILAIAPIFAGLSEYQEGAIKQSFYHQIIVPLQKCWKELDETLSAGEFAEAQKDVKFISNRWQSIQPDFSSDFSWGILKDLHDSKDGQPIYRREDGKQVINTNTAHREEESQPAAGALRHRNGEAQR